ncbi:hypothetical protein GUITHDRAFT_110739 [Guillardia theta CCMP2712]|uniref:Uncharacterized protein n=1 Tax=Guillardia theta (strain CCMP2712) TaxID=905079 RepID=L1J5E3_GUITC|nr:hypothetical protein GUITHDRAFT_110739 [Guillardia theta CCMP2712]EKX43324.1 hypothetical protein GUITHDRAFT_110739 [Guillardia theta CCMP2712]|eukprot:XP_005830304.1 hypothetical protein GUITHDRAFT_110739 [Guillardia theta CCMP2712]
MSDQLSEAERRHFDQLQKKMADNANDGAMVRGTVFEILASLQEFVARDQTSFNISLRRGKYLPQSCVELLCKVMLRKLACTTTISTVQYALGACSKSLLLYPDLWPMLVKCILGGMCAHPLDANVQSNGLYALGRLLEDGKERKEMVFLQSKAVAAGERLSSLMVESNVVEVTVIAMEHHQDTVTINNCCMLIRELVSLSQPAKSLMNEHEIVRYVMEGMENNEQDGELLIHCMRAFGDCVEDTEISPHLLDRIVSWAAKFSSKLKASDELVLNYCTLVRKVSQVPQGESPSTSQHLARQSAIASSGVLTKMLEIVDMVNDEEEGKNEFEPLTFIRSAELNESVRGNTQTQLALIGLGGFATIDRTLKRYDEITLKAFKFLYDEDKACRSTCILLLSSLFDGPSRQGRHEELLQTESGGEMAQITLRWMLSVANTSAHVQAVHDKARQWGLSLEE